MSTATTCPCGHPSEVPTRLPSSPFGSYLDTDIKPPNYDKALIEALISTAEAAIEAIDAELTHTLHDETHLTQLEASHASLVQFRDSHRRLLSPISRLPVELLRAIFKLAVDACPARPDDEDDDDSSYVPESDLSESDFESDIESDTESYDSDTNMRLETAEGALREPDDTDRYAQSDTSSVYEYDPEDDFRESMITTRPPWVLTHVCGAWRAVAFAFPQLWSSISMDVDITFRYFRTPSVALFERQLELAADCPLTVYFSCVWDLECARTYLDVLMRFSDRWDEVEFNINRTLESYLGKITGSVGRLRKMTLSSPIYHQSSFFPDAFATAPQLRAFIWDGFPNIPIPPQSSFPWSQLSHYRLRLSAADFLSLLSQTPNVVECDITIIEYRDPTARAIVGSTQQSVLLPHLTYFRLTLVVSPTVNIGEVLRQLVCPALHTWTLVDHWGRWHSDLAHVLDFVRRTRCSVCRLVPPVQWEQPDLSSLMLEVMPADSVMQLDLDVDEPSITFCPAKTSGFSTGSAHTSVDM